MLRKSFCRRSGKNSPGMGKGHMKRIFFIINSYSWGGGAEALLTLIVNHLNPEKYEIGIMEIIHADVKKEPVSSNIKLYPYYTLADAPDRKARMYYVYHEWDRVIREYIPQDYDLYVSFNYLKPSFLLPPGKKCIAWIHGDVYDLAADDKTEERQLQNEAFYKADRIVTISDITTESVKELFPEHKNKIQVLYNGIDIAKVREKALERTDVKLKHPAVMAVGRLDENKNPLRMLRIFEKLHKRMPEVHLYYLGYGKLAEDVSEQSIEYGIEENVHLLGYYDNPFPIMAQCDAVGMFSIAEGFPMALLESVALDKPFVSSVIGGARILANDGQCGRVVETDDEAAAAFVELLQENKSEQSRKCRESISRFGLGEYIGRIEKLFDEVLGE